VDNGAALPGEIPAGTRRRWDAAMAQLSDLVLAAPDLYQRAMALVGQIASTMRPDCTDPVSLLAAAGRAEAVAAAAARDTGMSAAGLRPDLIAAAALSMLSRELTQTQARRDRLARLRAAGEHGPAWVLVEETGEPGQALPSGYRRIDVHVPTGAAVIASIEPDETLTRPVYRVLRARIDPATGILGSDADGGSPAKEYTDRQAWEAAQARARSGQRG